MKGLLHFPAAAISRSTAAAPAFSSDENSP
jgi:hypothetical protein